MVRDNVLNSQLAKPTVNKVQMHLITKLTFGSDAKAITNNQHAAHQLRINQSMDGPYESKTASGIRGDHQSLETYQFYGAVVLRNHLLQGELVKQLRRSAFKLSHHGQSPRIFDKTSESDAGRFD